MRAMVSRMVRLSTIRQRKDDMGMMCFICGLLIVDGEVHVFTPKVAHEDCLNHTRCDSCEYQDKQCGICKQCVDWDKYSPSQPTEQCLCGELEELVIEHDNSYAGLRVRMTCPCGICSAWENSFDYCYTSWNDLVSPTGDGHSGHESTKVKKSKVTT